MFCYAAGMSASSRARARVRAELTREILAAAHEELAAGGAAALSLRAVARRLEMVPSALYRYFPNRDALLTALIVDAYEAVGAAAAAAAPGDPAPGDPAPVDPGPVDPGPVDRGTAAPAGPAALDRWLAVARAVRHWGHQHPHEWALVYGSPVPGYQAPRDTVAAALVVTGVIVDIFAAAVPPGAPPATWLPPAPAGLAEIVRPIEAELLPGRSPETVAAAVMAWTLLLGMVSLELFGHYVGATTDFDTLFDYEMLMVAGVAGLR
jgi:AcrR family transcriptional regulator